MSHQEVRCTHACLTDVTRTHGRQDHRRLCLHGRKSGAGSVVTSGRVTWESIELIAALQAPPVEPGPKPRAQAKHAFATPALEISSQRVCGQAQIHISQRQKHMTGHAARGRAARASTRQTRRGARVDTDKRKLSPVWRRLDPQELQCLCLSVLVLRATPSPPKSCSGSSVFAVQPAYIETEANSPPSRPYIQLALLPCICRLSWHAL